MALFKVSKGLKANLPPTKTEGYCWYTTDDSLFYIDYKDENGTLQRKALNAKDAETLTGASLSTILNSSDVEIPTSKAVLDALNAKLDKADAGSDWNQNDNTKPNYVKNRPFYIISEAETSVVDINWNGDTDGLTPSSMNHFYKVSDSVFTLEQFKQLHMICNGTDHDIGYDADNNLAIVDEYSNLIFYSDSGVMIATAENAGPNPGGAPDTFPETGVYFPSDGSVTRLYSVGQLILVPADIKTIDESFLPSSVLNRMDTNNPVGKGSFSLNRNTNNTIGDRSVAVGDRTTASGYASHAEGDSTTASGRSSHAECYLTTASGYASHSEGSYTTASGDDSHSEGNHTTASGYASHAEGYSSNGFPSTLSASSTNDDVITKWNTTKFSVAKADYSHVEGKDNLALGESSHAEGYLTTASGSSSHAEGDGTTASGVNSHAEGFLTTASGAYSHAEGEGTIASSPHQHVQGYYNLEDKANKYAHIVGNGDGPFRSNAHTLDWSGNAWYAGKVSIGTTSNVPTPTDVNDLVTKQYVDNKFSTKTASVTLAADSWTGTESPYSQVVTIDGVTANSKVDLNPTGEQLNSIATNRTILNTANDNGTVTVYAVGNKPTEDYTMQVTITEV